MAVEARVDERLGKGESLGTVKARAGEWLGTVGV